MYKYDDFESFRDFFEFILIDGKFNIIRIIFIMILFIDDEIFRLFVNNGLDIEVVGGKKLIINNYLRVEDIDLEDLKIIFIIRGYFRYGYVMKRGYDGVVRNLILYMNFIQFDIDNNRIWYVYFSSKSG